MTTNDDPIATREQPELADGERRCGRCQKVFPGDPSRHATAIPDWWVCDACRAVLLP
jgi:hypothetical protein